MQSISFALFIAGASLFATVVFAAPLEKIKFIKIAPQDAKAVIKAADGKLQVIKPGDMIGDAVTVKEIAPGRIVLEEKTDQGAETVIVRMENDRSRIERLRKQPETRPILVTPNKNER